MERNFSAVCIRSGYTLEEIEKDINEIKSGHEYLNRNAQVSIEVDPEPKNVCFDGYSKKQFNVSISVTHE